MFCSRSVSDQDGGHDKDFSQVSVPSAPTSPMRLLTTCVVKLFQLVDMTRCASYDASAMTNSAAKVHKLDCVSSEKSVWRSFDMGDKYSTKVQG